MTPKKVVYHWVNQKIHREFQHLLKADHSRPCIAPLKVSPRVPVAFPSCPYTKGIHIMHLRWCWPTNLRKIKSENDLHLETQDTSAMPQEKLKKILSNYWVSNKNKYCLKYTCSINIKCHWCCFINLNMVL